MLYTAAALGSKLPKQSPWLYNQVSIWSQPWHWALPSSLCFPSVLAPAAAQHSKVQWQAELSFPVCWIILWVLLNFMNFSVVGFSHNPQKEVLSLSQGSVAAGQRLICACLHPPAWAALGAPLFSCCLEFPFPWVHLASGSPALNTWMLSALIMPSSDWANRISLGTLQPLFPFLSSSQVHP